MTKSISYSVGIIALLVMAILISAMAPIVPAASGAFTFSFILAAALVFVVSLLRKWTHFPYLPYVGLLLSALGYIVGQDWIRTSGLTIFAVFMILHEFGIEQRRESAVSPGGKTT